jgi:prolipoprotein diacylglyceryltransferase
MPLYFVLYGLFRFVVEFYRGDHNPVRMFNLSDQQVFSLAFAAFGLILFAILWRRNAKPAERSRAASA